jgi:hypothetical protein
MQASPGASIHAQNYLATGMSVRELADAVNVKHPEISASAKARGLNPQQFAAAGKAILNSGIYRYALSPEDHTPETELARKLQGGMDFKTYYDSLKGKAAKREAITTYGALLKDSSPGLVTSDVMGTGYASLMAGIGLSAEQKGALGINAATGSVAEKQRQAARKETQQTLEEVAKDKQSVIDALSSMNKNTNAFAAMAQGMNTSVATVIENLGKLSAAVGATVVEIHGIVARMNPSGENAKDIVDNARIKLHMSRPDAVIKYGKEAVEKNWPTSYGNNTVRKHAKVTLKP